MKYRKRPVVIEAVRWSPDSDLPQWATEKTAPGNLPHLLEVQTLEGVMTVRSGDWLIKGVHGEVYPCKPDIFAATYEPVVGSEEDGE